MQNKSQENIDTKTVEERKLIAEQDSISRAEYLRSWWITAAIVTVAVGVATLLMDFHLIVDLVVLVVVICVCTYSLLHAVAEQGRMRSTRLREELNQAHLQIEAERLEHEAQQSADLERYANIVRRLRDRVGKIECLLSDELDIEKGDWNND